MQFQNQNSPNDSFRKRSHTESLAAIFAYQLPSAKHKKRPPQKPESDVGLTMSKSWNLTQASLSTCFMWHSFDSLAFWDGLLHLNEIAFLRTISSLYHFCLPQYKKGHWWDPLPVFRGKSLSPSPFY